MFLGSGIDYETSNIQPHLEALGAWGAWKAELVAPGFTSLWATFLAFCLFVASLFILLTKTDLNWEAVAAGGTQDVVAKQGAVGQKDHSTDSLGCAGWV